MAFYQLVPDLEEIQCPQITFCCNVMTANFTIGGSSTYRIYDQCMLFSFLVGLLYVLWRLQRGLYTYFSVYLKTLALYLTLGILYTVVSFSPLQTFINNSSEFSATVVDVILRYFVFTCIGVIDLWLCVFLFQRDLSRSSVLRALSVSVLIYCIFLMFQGIIFFVLLSKFRIYPIAVLVNRGFLYHDIVASALYFVVNFFLFLFPWKKSSCRPRPALKVMLIFNIIVRGFAFLGYLAVFIPNITACPSLIGHTLNGIFYSFVLFKVVATDSEFWSNDLSVLGTENHWRVVANSINQTRRVGDFPRIYWKDIVPKNTIGEGRFSQVYEGYWQETRVAIKKFKTEDMDSMIRRKLTQDLVTESQILKALRHPNIVQFLGFVVDPPELAIVMEYMNKGSLYGILRQIRKDMKKKKKHVLHPPLSELLKIQILTDIGIGMNYLHSHDPVILHRDLKSTNVLVNSEWQCKIADFGLSRLQPVTESQRMSLVGTPAWAAPEVLRRETYNKKADVWSFGIIVWELIAYQRPFADKTQDSIFAAAQKNTTPIIPDECPQFFHNLMMKCWKIPPSARPSFVQIVNKLLQYQPSNMSETVIPLQVIHTTYDETIDKKKRKKETILKRFSIPDVSRNPDMFLTSTSEEQQKQIQEEWDRETIIPAGYVSEQRFPSRTPINTDVSDYISRASGTPTKINNEREISRISKSPPRNYRNQCILI